MNDSALAVTTSNTSNFRIEPQDHYFMQLAIECAKKGLYSTRPNPAVGCVLVKDDMMVGTGFHPKAGMPHAEVYALRQAGVHASGATAYVTLEPCSHTGRTPPCAKALIEAGIRRVVVAGLDPNPKVAGKGIQLLQQAGIEVAVGVQTAAAQALNKGFLQAMRTQMPYVRLKIASSLDGRTAMASGESKWITGTAAREDVQHIRARSGAIITGSQTIIDDDPSLNVRSHTLGIDIEDIPQPKVVVLDRRQRLINKDYKVLSYPHTLLYTQSDLETLLRSLVVEHQIYDVLIESGSQVAGSFIAANLVDEIILYQAPCILGHTGKPMLTLSIDKLCEQRLFHYHTSCQIGKDMKVILTKG
ncbi:bifunctional diaminohydroxyphosphoribosylaminopyrimidine deaminase/5-amino-6-(5-phosphoribosylamino)uracil reductase RibD [Psychrobacter sp. I-STPA10]|uniref:bifunctional diaminohydroxyphosphoribosylaminopyrimidine deaminase/5-amino-6-(5-phosphoribosylamino)uracil reductase RibD n=1 Tax=Psychrobacter sp. I-STPA10 TaxID=2585769 RepID=UPI001E5A4017|nr:bifunctional diaminohydroxyphosphoribosylaminopyrimidine deaminase/5-amino-6-(5-phosphoribosylamino)uracil reductase RibD [Psychrobacter sp. I-STPA10]